MKSFAAGNRTELMQQLLGYAASQDVFCLFNSNRHRQPHSSFDLQLAIGARRELLMYDHRGAFEALIEFNSHKTSPAVGYLAYDLKNDVERLSSENEDRMHFPLLHFFEPCTLIEWKEDEVQIHSFDGSAEEEIWQKIKTWPLMQAPASTGTPISLNAQIPREAYLEKVQEVIRHIEEGDVYEMNLCQEFYADEVNIDPLQCYMQLNDLSPMPFSACYKYQQQYILCASPERFIRKHRDTLLSQPIKGTARRSDDPLQDEEIKRNLQNDLKERAENVMIVDLVRNDLARSAVTGTIRVEELFGIYSFAHLHQMISSVSARLRPGTHPIDAIRHAFPMGSMTGAPKVRAMQLIEELEESKRGVYSGAIGYITEKDDFDFNVVIRSIFYDAGQKRLSFQVGGAITYDSIPEKEYEECMLKAKAITEVLQNQQAK